MMPAVRRGSPEYERLLEEERLIVAITETIYSLMQGAGVSKAELANRLGRSRAFVSQILTGERNLTFTDARRREPRARLSLRSRRGAAHEEI